MFMLIFIKNLISQLIDLNEGGKYITFRVPTLNGIILRPHTFRIVTNDFYLFFVHPNDLLFGQLLLFEFQFREE